MIVVVLQFSEIHLTQNMLNFKLRTIYLLEALAA